MENKEHTLNQIQEKILEIQTTIKREKQKEQALKVTKTIGSCLLWIFSALLLALCVNNLYQQLFSSNSVGLFGFGQAVVASNSMNSPTSENPIKQNDLVFFKPLDRESLDIGDIVIYEKTYSNGDSALIIHRIVDIADDLFVAKGDNNTLPDDPMPLDAIVGQYLLKINNMGLLFNSLKNPLILIALIILLLTISVFRICLYNKKRQKTLAAITKKPETQDALAYFFDL